MPLRTQKYRESCERCDEPARSRCVRCAKPLCSKHRPPRKRRCDSCEAHYLEAVERVNGGATLVGGDQLTATETLALAGTGIVATGGLLVLVGLPLGGVVAAGAAALGWTGWISIRRAGKKDALAATLWHLRRNFLKQRRPQALIRAAPAARPTEQKDDSDASS